MGLTGTAGARLVLALAWSLCSAAAIAADPSQAPAAEGTRMSKDHLLTAPEPLGEIPFGPAGITYIPSDMGPDSARWPAPVLLLPDHGIWMVDPGADLSSWRLLRFSMEGRKLLNADLAHLLELSEPRLMIPMAMAADRDNGVFLVAARSFDFKSGSPLDLVRARLDEQGRPDLITTLPVYDATSTLLAVDGGTVFSRILKGKHYVWCSIDENGDRHGGGSAPVGSQPVAVGGRLLERVDGRTFRVVGQDAVRLTLEGGPSSGSVPVAGDASIFGFVRVEPVALDLAASGAYVQARELEVLKLDLPNSRVVNLGRQTLPPNRFYDDPAMPFQLHRPGQARFDREGNFFDLVWRADALRVYVQRASRAASRF